MLILRNKNFAHVDYKDLSKHGKDVLKELRGNIAKNLWGKRYKLRGKDKALKDALHETYVKGAKYEAEVARKAAEMI